MTTTTTSQATPLTGEQVIKMMGQVNRADTVELKATLAATGETGRRLDLDPLGAQIRQVVFFDTPDLALSKHGLVVRARRSAGRPDDSVVKTRPVDPATLPKRLRQLPQFGVEVDVMPGGFVCSASLKGVVEDETAIRRTIRGDSAIRKLFSKEQRAFYKERAPEGLALDDLSVMGPILVLKLKWRPDELPHKMVAELWLYPDGSLILELSTKCQPSRIIETIEDTRAFLHRRGVDLAPVQATKTRTALEYFSQQLLAEAEQPA